jgi:hypothetical protein
VGAVALGAAVLLAAGQAGVGAFAAPPPAAGAALLPGQGTTFLLAPGVHRPGALAPFPDGAPARVTGGFGEDSCVGCHWEREVNEGPGTLRLEGVPEAYEPGKTYLLEVELEHPTMVLAGFQVAARFASDTTQAGSFSVPEEEAHRVGIQEDRGVQFAQHLEAGTHLDGAPGRERASGEEPASGADGAPATRWRIRWTAPSEAGGVIHFHLAAVAADGDRSQMGDDVHTLEVTSRP